jgi:hypothetical protein
MQSPASSSGSGLTGACFIAVSRRCSNGEKIDGRDMEVRTDCRRKVTIQTCMALFLSCGIRVCSVSGEAFCGAKLLLRSVHIL